MDFRKRPYKKAVIEIVDIASSDLITTSSSSDSDIDREEIEDNISPDTWL